MQSFAWMNGEVRQHGPPSRSPQGACQLSHNTMRNPQTGTANESKQYTTAITGVQPPQIAKFTHYGPVFQRQPSKLQTSAVPHQADYFVQTAGGNNYLQHSTTNLQSGNPSLPVTYGLQQNFHQKSAQISLTQNPPTMMLAYTVYPQQDFSSNWNQSVGVHGEQSIRTQNANIVSDRHHCWGQNSFFHNLNGESIKPVSANTTTATPPQHGDVAHNGTFGPAAEHNRPTAHNHIHRQNGTPHCSAPPSYNEATFLSLRNNSNTTNSSSSEQNLHVSSTSPIFQQYSTHNSGGEATASINSNSYCKQYETILSLLKQTDSPVNPAVDAQQEMLRRQRVARIEDYLRESSTAGLDGCPQVYTSSHHGRKQVVSRVTTTESDQNIQLGTSTVAEIYNANASQTIPQDSRYSLPKTNHNVMSTQQHVDVPPQQSSVPNGFYVSATGDGIGNVNQAAFFPENNVGSLSDASQLMPEGIIPPGNENQTHVANHCERLEMLSVKANDSSIHSSPGRTRAVAVVQPLSQESYQVASMQTSSNNISQLSEGPTTDESLSNPEKLFIPPKNTPVRYLKVGPYLLPGNPKQLLAQKYAIRHSAASNDATCMSLSSLAGPQDLPQKQICTVDMGSKLDIDTQVHQRVAPTAQQLVTSKAPVSGNGEKDKTEMPIDTKGALELSSVPTTPWTPVTLTKYIQYSEKPQMMSKDIAMPDVVHKLFSMFWDGDPENLKSALKSGMYIHLITDVKKFCNEHLTPESVILSQVKTCFRRQMKSYHILKDKEVYSELPYQSSWLNVNEQLDDIDKEFDFPQILKHHIYRLKSDIQPDQVETDDSISAQTVNEVSNKMSSPELKQLDPSEEKLDSSVEAPSKPTSSPKKTESADSSDPYSFKIQVFSPENAKVIFEQAQSKLPESMDMDYQPEKALDSSVEGKLPKVIYATLSNPKLDNKTFCPIEEVCCIERWKETICGSDTSSLTKCQCKIKQSHKDIAANPLDNEVMAVQEKDACRSDSKFQSAAEEENQAKGGESDYQVMTFLWPEIVNVFSQDIDFPEDTDKPDSHYDKDPNNIYQISMDSSQSSIILISDEEEHLSSIESEILNQMPDFENDSAQAQVKLTERCQSNGSDEKETNKISRNYTEIQSDPEVECVQDQLKSTGNMKSCTSVRSDTKTEKLSTNESEATSRMTELKENCGQAQLTSTNVAESWETEEEQTQNNATGAQQKFWSGKLKRLSSPDRFLPVSKKSKKCKSLGDVDSQPFLEGASKCGKVFVHATDSEPSASNIRTVELVLFGSTTQDKCVLPGSRNNYISSPEVVSDAVARPPKVLTVNLSPLKKKPIRTVQTWEYSVKRLYKKWKISLPPAKIRHKRKLKPPKCTFAPLFVKRRKKAERFCPTDTEELPVSSEMRVLSGKTKPCPNLRWRRSLSEELPFEEQKEKHTIMINKPAEQKRNKAENGSNAVVPLQNNDVLKFSVLPVSFNFGSNGRKETNAPVPGKTDLVEGKDNSDNNTLSRARGTWWPIAEKKHRFFPIPETYSLFQKFQKKYKEKMQPYVDE
ncbi:uncharacterized protein si:ch211-106e7.2 [Anoplopoma fimbria]|uniref:uncharacterized protein si:ch211-106e7.2 n=1 Tax=Anoplopoma fimbria TaxID=229290 RepID=UPI0023EB3EFA|nr:uncharacterized protein si:ch211-106e7.2 [Anoplopoma fimbria]